jgi:hypothetical protein
MGMFLAVHYGTPPSKNQIDNDVNWGISCSPVEGCTKNVTQICGASFDLAAFRPRGEEWSLNERKD